MKADHGELGSPSVAELPTNDTMLCAEELAPVELDAAPVQIAAAASGPPQEEVDESPIIPQSACPASEPPRSAPLAERSLVPKDKRYSQLLPQREPDRLDPNVRDMPRSALMVMAPTSQAIVVQAQPAMPQISFTLASGPETEHNSTEVKPLALDRSGQADRVQATLSSLQPRRPTSTHARSKSTSGSLQPQEPIKNRSRSKSTSDEPWTPTIKFIQAGPLQESKVSRSPGLSPASLRSKDLESQPGKLNRVSEWLVRQSFGEPSLDPESAVVPARVSSEAAGPVAVDSSRKQAEPSRSPSRLKPEPLDATSMVTRSVQTSPISPVKHTTFMRPRDNVVESVIEVPAGQSIGSSRGVQLVDAPSALARRGAKKGKQDWQRPQKRFSWETEVNPTPATEKPAKPCSPSAQRSSRQGSASLQPSPAASPRLIPGTNLSPSHGNKAVLVEHPELQPCIATVEISDKSLPPAPLTLKERPNPELTPKQPASKAFEQISELIAVTNAAIPSARRLTAIHTTGTGSETDWNRKNRPARRSTPPSPEVASVRPLTPSYLSATHLAVRPNSHKRSTSQQNASLATLKPPEPRNRSRSQSLMSPVVSAGPSPFADNNRSLQNATIRRTAEQAKAAANDGHKSHLKPSVHLTSTGSFPFHPLRSSPLVVPADDPSIGDTADAAQQTPTPLKLDVNPTTKASAAPRSQSPKLAPRPLLQVQVPSQPGLPGPSRPYSGLPLSPRPRYSGLPTSPRPSFPGLPTSPRPVSRIQPMSYEKAGADKLNKESDSDKVKREQETDSTSNSAEGVKQAQSIKQLIAERQSTPERIVSEPESVTPAEQMVDTVAVGAERQHCSDSVVSSPTSSIFSSLRDSSVSATSSMADAEAHSSPLSDLEAEMAMFHKNQAELIRQHRRMPSRARQQFNREQMPVEAKHMHASDKPLAAGPPLTVSRVEIGRDEETFVAVQRPKDIPEAIRPAGTRAISQKVATKVHESAPARPQIPTVVVRAPTVKLRPPQLALDLKGRIEQRPPTPEMSSAPLTPLPQESVVANKASSVACVVPPMVPQDSTTNVDTEHARVVTTPPAIEVTTTPAPCEPAPTPTFGGMTFEDVFKQPLVGVTVKQDDPIEEQPRPARPQSFLASLRKSWQTTTGSDSPRSSLTAPRPSLHTRTQSENTIAPSQGRIAGALAMATKRASQVWQRNEDEQDHWPNRESLPVDTTTISNVGAAIRFFNSSIQGLRAKSEAVEKIQEVSPMEEEKEEDDIVTTTVVMRRIGPPVVVRIPSTPGRTE